MHTLVLNKTQESTPCCTSIVYKARSSVTIFCLVFVCFITSCGPVKSRLSDDNANPGNFNEIRPSTGSNQDIGSSTNFDGTSDPGGGNGTNGKTYESYAFNVGQWPAFKNVLRPMFKYLDGFKFASSTSNKIVQTYETPYTAMWKMKSWYLIPGGLAKLSKETVGVSFLKSDMQQIARQSEKEVWIDKDLFSKMTEQEQAELILHEIVESIYLLKFLSGDELCLRTKSAIPGPDGDCEIKNSPPVEKTRTLNQADYESIRTVTSWFFTNLSSKPEEEKIDELFAINRFDPRLFKIEDIATHDALFYPQVVDNIKIPLESFKQTMLANEKVQSPSKTLCRLNSMKKDIPCKMNFSFEDRILNNDSKTFMKYKLEIDKQAIVFEENVLTTVYTDLYKLNRDDEPQFVTKYFNQTKNTYVVGEKIYSGYLIFYRNPRIDPAPLELRSIVLLPGIITPVIKTRESAPNCGQIAPTALDALTDKILIQNSDNEDSSVLESKLLIASPHAYCWLPKQ